MKRDPHAMRKAPHAPKRFKSSYICFFMAKQGEIKKALGSEATVSLISKRSAEMWYVSVLCVVVISGVCHECQVQKPRIGIVDTPFLLTCHHFNMTALQEKPASR